MERHVRSRRRFLVATTRIAAATALPALALPARAELAPRHLPMVHTHTGERVDLVYAAGGHYLPGPMQALNRFLRDHYSGQVGTIDPGVLDLLHTLRGRFDEAGPFEIISGYRGAGTNEQLRLTRGGGVATRSLHMEGRAIDVRLAGVALSDLRDAALELKGGGVGYYPRERFVHVDTGRVRRW